MREGFSSHNMVMRYTILRILSCRTSEELSRREKSERTYQTKLQNERMQIESERENKRNKRKIRKAFSANALKCASVCSCSWHKPWTKPFALFHWVGLQSSRRCSEFSWPFFSLSALSFYYSSLAKKINEWKNCNFHFIHSFASTVERFHENLDVETIKSIR